MPDRRPTIGILQCGHVAPVIAGEHGTYIDWFRNFLEPQGFDLPSWPVVDGEFPESPELCDGWLLTGSPLGAWEDHAFIEPLMAFVHKVAESGRPMIGICFGHQLIARAFGGVVGKHPGGIKIGRQTYELDGLGPITLNAWHNDQVAVPPAGAEILGTGEDCAVPAMKLGERILTLQTHPEMTNACLLGLIALRRDSGTFAPGQIEQAEAGAALTVDSDRVAQWFAEFYKSGIQSRAETLLNTPGA